jgi:DNA gyrase subunit A
VLITSNGQAIRFPVSVLRSASRTSAGVRGIKLEKGGKVVSLEVVTPGHELFSITEKGMGKRTPFGEYRVTNRGGQGVRNYSITPKTGKVVASRTVNSRMELIVISKDGIVIRTAMDQIRMTGRATQGVTVINVGPGDSVASLATIDMGGNGGPKGPEAKQPPLAGLEPAAPAAKTPAKDAKKQPAKKPTPIRGRMKPKPMQSRAKAASKPAPKPAPRSKTLPKGKPKPKRR